MAATCKLEGREPTAGSQRLATFELLLTSEMDAAATARLERWHLAFDAARKTETEADSNLGLVSS